MGNPDSNTFAMYNYNFLYKMNINFMGKLSMIKKIAVNTISNNELNFKSNEIVLQSASSQKFYNFNLDLLSEQAYSFSVVSNKIFSSNYNYYMGVNKNLGSSSIINTLAIVNAATNEEESVSEFNDNLKTKNNFQYFIIDDTREIYFSYKLGVNNFIYKRSF